MKIEFTHRFEAAHRFLDASSKCSTPHGHTWYITLELEHSKSDIKPELNYAEDFKDLKKNWRAYIDEELDHHFFLNEKDPLLHHLKKTEPNLRIKTTKGDPTTEVLALKFFKKSLEIFKNFAKVQPVGLRLKETPTNSVSVTLGDLC